MNSRRHLAAIALFLAACSPRGDTPSLIVATTTSVYESGLLDSLIQRFEATHRVTVKPISVGSGAALVMAARGDADLVITHDPAAEARARAAGDLLARVPLMHNDFLVVGPKSDPADFGGVMNVEGIFHALARSGVFVSRGDGSGTETRERMLWDRAGVDPDSLPNRIETGQGMSATLFVANERQAYTLVDRATWLTLRRQVALVPFAEGDSLLLNFYSAHPVNPARHAGVQAALARQFIAFLVSPAAQQYIGQFAVQRLGGQLYVPDAPP